MSLFGILIGLLNIVLVVAILLLIGLIIMWVLGALNWSPPEAVRKGYIVVVAVVALIMVVQLLAGVPSIHIVTTG